MIKSLEALFEKEKENFAEEFKQLYEKYYPVVLKHSAYLTGSIQAGEDIAQETFIKLYHSPPNHANVIAWLTRVSSNLSYNYLRDTRNRAKKEPDIAEDNVGNVINIEDAAIKNHEIRVTRRILNSLPARDRICLLLKFSGFKYSEIAGIAGMDAGSVGTTLARAQAKFRERYGKEGHLQ